MPCEKEAAAKKFGAGRCKVCGRTKNAPLSLPKRGMSARARQRKDGTWTRTRGRRQEASRLLASRLLHLGRLFEITCRRSFLLNIAASGVFGLAFRPRPSGLLDKGAEAPFADRRPGPGHQVLIIGEIDLRQSHHGQDLARLDEMAPIGARIGPRDRRRRQRIDRARIIRKARIAEVEAAARSEERRVGKE